MRKILLGTTAVVGAALLAPAAFAQAPVTVAPQSLGTGTTMGTQAVTAPAPAMAAPGGLQIRLGGYFDFSAAMIYDDWDQARSRNSSAANGSGPNGTASNRRSRYDFRNDAELYVFVEGRASNGMTYGATFEFQMDNSQGTAADNSNVSMDELWGFISFPNLGTVRFGAEDSAASLLAVRAPSAGLVASDGDWYDFISNPGLYSSPYMLSGINDGNDATKVIYLSPQWAGFDFGVSYAANAGEGERNDLANGQQQRDQTILQNELSAAIRYRGTFGPVGVNAGFGAMRADSPRLNANGTSPGILRMQDVTAYTVGLNVSAYGFALGGEYTWGAYNGSSVGRTALNPGLDDSQHWLVGATYTVGPLLVGANYGQGKQSNGTNAAGVSLPDREHTAWGIGAVYTLAPGLGLYAIYQNINDENIPTSAGPRDARYGAGGTTLASFNGSNTRTINVGMVGVRLAF